MSTITEPHATRWERAKANPADLERCRRYSRECAARRRAKARTDAALAQSLRDAQARWYAKVRNDPERWARMLEDARIGYYLRNGGRTASRARHDKTGTHPSVPLAPFADWLTVAARRFETGDLMAEVLGITPRNLHRLRGREGDTVHLDTVDRALTVLRGLEVDGRPIWTLDDLYPEEAS